MTRVQKAARARHPEEPWLWREDWAARRVEDGSRGGMIAAWVLAGFWNLVSFPSAFLAVRAALSEGRYGGLLALIFPAIGVGLLVWAARATLRFRRFGVSRLELEAVPVPPGGELRGTVLVPARLEAPDGLCVTLTCLRRVTRGSGKNRSTSERVLWREERRATVVQARRAEGMTSSIPVAVTLPRDAEPSSHSNPRDQVVWRLRVTADVPGVDYSGVFEVPVFRTAGPVPAGTSAFGPAPEPFIQPASSRVRVTRNRRGIEVLFPAARNPRVSGGLTAFVTIWLAAVWATVRFDAPLFFQLTFGAVGILLAWAAVSSWLGVSRVTVGDGAVTLARGLLAPVRERRLAAAEVAEVTTRIGMQSGDTPYYDVVLVRKDGRRVPAGRSIRDKREADWLADTLREALRT